MKGSGFSEIIIESGITRVMSGKLFNRALRVHKLHLEALERLMLTRFEEKHSREDCLSNEIFNMLRDLIATPSKKGTGHGGTI